jgi:DNA-directed RNA polymerase I, II, and III subunit RPABC2
MKSMAIEENDYRTILSNYDVSKNNTRPQITIYEKTILIGKRATQIAYGATPLITVTPGMNEIAIAEEELKQRKLPLIIKRKIGNYIEYWKPQDMILI